MNAKTSKRIRRNVVYAVYGKDISKDDVSAKLKEEEIKSMIRGAKRNYNKDSGQNPILNQSKRQKRLKENIEKFKESDKALPIL